jgi:hypothetical protein
MVERVRNEAELLLLVSLTVTVMKIRLHLFTVCPS